MSERSLMAILRPADRVPTNYQMRKMRSTSTPVPMCGEGGRMRDTCYRFRCPDFTADEGVEWLAAVGASFAVSTRPRHLCESACATELSGEGLRVRDELRILGCEREQHVPAIPPFRPRIGPVPNYLHPLASHLPLLLLIRHVSDANEKDMP